MSDPELLISPVFRTLDIQGVKIWNSLLVIPCALFIPRLRSLLDSFVFEPAWLKVSGNPSKSTKDRKKRVKEIKWRESCWELVAYTAFTIMGLLASYREKWFSDTRYFWLGCTQIPCNHEVSGPLMALYITECSFYLQAIYGLVTTQGPRKKDHNQMIIHHAATLLLVVYSYTIGLMRSGCMIFLLHDVCDVFLQAAKLVKYAKQEAAATSLFVVFLVVWIGTRLTYLPFYVLPSLIYETIELVVIPFGVNPHPHYHILIGSVIVLVICHIIWTYLILKVLFKTVMTKKTDDIREDSDSEYED